MLRERRSSEAKCRPLKGEKDDVYRAVRTINRYEQCFVANKHRYM